MVPTRVASRSKASLARDSRRHISHVGDSIGRRNLQRPHSDINKSKLLPLMKRTKKQSQPRRRWCKKCGKPQKGRGGKRKADELEENLAGMRVKKARGDMTEEDYSKERKALLETYSGQTGPPMSVDGEEIKQHYGPTVKARRRKPTDAENDLQLHEIQRAILGPTHTDEAFMERKEASATWPKQEDPTRHTDWRTVPGYPKLPTNASGQVTLDRNQVASDYSLMRAPGALKSVISRAISALGVTKSVGYKAATYALKNPLVILQYGAVGLTLYQTWNYWGPIVEAVFKALGWLLESGARANAQGSAYTQQNFPELPQVTSPTGVVYTELPSATQVLQSVGRDLVSTVLQQALEDPAKKANVQAVLETTVEVAKVQQPGFMEGIANDAIYGLNAPLRTAHGLFALGKSIYNRGQAGTGRAHVQDLLDRGF